MGLARAGRVPEPGSLLWNLKTLMFVLLVVGVPSVLADSATTKQYRVPQLTPAPQRWRHSPEDGLCPPGTHMSEDGRDCPSCIYGVDYTTHRNALPSCLLCSICNSDEEESSPCTMTANRECQCKAGTFRGEDSPEFCQKCRTRCPDGMVENRTCTPWSDLVCVPKGSDSGLQLGRNAAIGVGCLLLCLVPICRSCWRKLQGLQDQDSQQKMEIEEPEVLAGVTVTSPGQSERLLNFQNDACPESDMLQVAQPAGCQAALDPRIPDSDPGCPHSLFPGQAGAEGSHRQRLLVPADSADPTDAPSSPISVRAGPGGDRTQKPTTRPAAQPRQRLCFPSPRVAGVLPDRVSPFSVLDFYVRRIVHPGSAPL
nr:tumor necrosis factor receptor superfamily member 10B-like [Microcebus murinus]